MTLGIARNPYATNVSTQLAEAAAEHDIPIRVIDLPTLTVDISLSGQAAVRDAAGVIDITSLAPYLLFGYPTAAHAFRILSRRAYLQNPVDSVLMADDKAATAVQLAHAALPQVPSTICPLDLERVLSVAAEIHYPVVIKRTHGAQGRWVRRADHAAALTEAFDDLASEGPGELIVQPEIAEFHGRSIRAVITGGHLLAATLRTATGNEWRSNIGGGATQHPVDLTPNEHTLAEDAARVLGLGHAGVDILRTARGPLILEVNSCPDFTSMLPYFDEDLTRAVLLTCLPPTAPSASLRAEGSPMSTLPPDFFTKPVSEVDPEIAEVLAGELSRQEHTLEMIASENFVPQAVLDCQGSVLTNKYAEGYPGRRYYGGCEHVDVAEQLAIDRAKELFGAEHANVQPHSGASANAIVYSTLMDHGDTFLGMALDHGGHLTHGMRINFSGLYYNVVPYGVDRETSRVDMDEVARLAKEHRPKMILAGWSAYPRQLDFARFREIADEVGAYLFVDMAHFAGLVAAGEHPNPVPHADVVSTTIHKTLGGPRSGMILCKEEFAKKINSRTFPGWQGGPLMHVIAAKAVALKIAASAVFRERQQRTRAGARALAEEMLGGGLNVLTGGTDVHLVLADLRESPLNGRQAEDRLAEIGITVNRNAVPFDPRPPSVASGLRIGTAPLATRGLQEDDFHEIGKIIAAALTGDLDDTKRASLRERSQALAKRYPLYPQLATNLEGR